MKSWFTIKSKATGVVDISIHEEIGTYGVSAKDFVSAIREYPDARVINLSVNSPGGSVFDGFAIHNALKAHAAKVYAFVEGIAASAASYVLMAADTISMPEDSFLMIHNPHAMAMGDADDMRGMADTLQKVQSVYENAYATRTGLEVEQIRDMMKAESFMVASEALELGFIDTITDAVGVAARIQCFEKYFASLPCETDSVVDQIDAIESLPDFRRFLRDAGGFSRKAADAMVARAKIVFPGEPEDDSRELENVAKALDRVAQRLT